MNYRGMLYLSLVLFVGLVSLWGCPKKAEMTSSPEAQKENVTEMSTPAPEVKSAEEKSEMKSEWPGKKSEIAAEGLKPIYFDFDKSFVRDDAKDVMKANAAWLKANPKAKIRIEGNCDERGTIEYNQALGQRRAATAKQYLTALGVSENRVKLISYGKEKSSCNEHDETCWQKNRKDDFVVIAD
jgi:peptidoglycan-associated lipoprotein